jgi:hypothetical protein
MPPKIEQRKERFELRVTQEGHKPEEHLAKLLAFAHRARTAITEKTKSYAELYDCLVGQVPKGVKPFGPLRAVLIVREIGHALKGVVRDGTGLEVDTMPSANEHRVALNLTLRDGQRATLQSHLGRVDGHLASLHTAAAAMMPAHVYEKVAELHDAAAVVVDKEPVSCETMRELRDLHAVLIQKKKISSNCLGRQIIVHGTGPGANKELDYVYRGARKTMSLSLSAAPTTPGPSSPPTAKVLTCRRYGSRDRQQKRHFCLHGEGHPQARDDAPRLEERRDVVGF